MTIKVIARCKMTRIAYRLHCPSCGSILGFDSGDAHCDNGILTIICPVCRRYVHNPINENRISNYGEPEEEM